jgi:hypothetical protein
VGARGALNFLQKTSRDSLFALLKNQSHPTIHLVKQRIAYPEGQDDCGYSNQEIDNGLSARFSMRLGRQH